MLFSSIILKEKNDPNSDQSITLRQTDNDTAGTLLTSSTLWQIYGKISVIDLKNTDQIFDFSAQVIHGFGK